MKMNSIDYTPFKLSDLSSINSVEKRDLFLVSDYDGGKCLTRKMTIGQFLSSDPVKLTISAEVEDMIIDMIRSPQLSVHLSAAVMEVVKKNWVTVKDSLDGSMDNQFVIDGGSGQLDLNGR